MEVGAHDRLPVVVAEVAQGLLDEPGRDQPVGRVARDVAERLRGRRVDQVVLPGPHLRGPGMVDHRVAGDPEEPDPQRGQGGVVAVGGAPRLEERLLDDVLGGAGVAEPPEQEAVELRAVLQVGRVDLVLAGQARHRRTGAWLVHRCTTSRVPTGGRHRLPHDCPYGSAGCRVQSSADNPEPRAGSDCRGRARGAPRRRRRRTAEDPSSSISLNAIHVTAVSTCEVVPWRPRSVAVARPNDPKGTDR